MKKRVFGELEESILQILKSGERMTIKHVLELLGGQDKYTTIMTVMNRLVEKNMLQREKIGLQYEYWIVASHAKLPSFIEKFKQKIFGIKTTAMVSYLIESANDITDEDLVEMEKMIEKAKQERRNK